MATCRRCGKWGLFLWVDSVYGYCQDCYNAYQREKAFREFEEMQAAKEKAAAEKFYNGIKPVKGTLTCKNGQKISTKVVGSKFDLKKILNVYAGVYVLGDDDVELVRDDIRTIDKILADFKEEHNSIPRFILNADKAKFKPVYDARQIKPYSILGFNSLTTTGKPPKYAMYIDVFESIDRNCRIHYLQNGEIGKAELVFDTDRQYRITMSIKKSQLVVDKITAWTPDAGTAELYKYSEA
jgi:hypothetical protein